MATNPIIICGPTATGKSDLAVSIAKKIGGEVISADSRQVYKNLDIGTGKITVSEMKDIPHYMLDIVNAKKAYNVFDYQKKAKKHLKEIVNNKHIPIICGGTGYYIDSLINNTSLVDVKQNPKLRKQLNTKSTEELYKILKKLDSKRAASIDKYNRVRLIRAIEIAKALGYVPEIKKEENSKAIFIGIDFDDETLRKRIKLRVIKRIKQGMLKEAEKLHRDGLSIKRMKELGLEYRHLANYLISKQKGHKFNQSQFVDSLSMDIWHYAKRQRTWFRRNKNIHWIINPKDKKEAYNKALEIIT